MSDPFIRTRLLVGDEPLDRAPPRPRRRVRRGRRRGLLR